jgi:hypothetical protein
MKAIVAAVVAALLLYVVDTEYNEGRYSQVVRHAAESLIGR